MTAGMGAGVRPESVDAAPVLDRELVEAVVPRLLLIWAGGVVVLLAPDYKENKTETIAHLSLKTVHSRPAFLN